MIDENGKHHPTPEAGIPQHMIDGAHTKTQKKAFAKLKKAEKAEPAKSAEKSAAKK